MSSKGRNYNPRHALPPKKKEEVIQSEEIKVDEDLEYGKSAMELDDIPIVSGDLDKKPDQETLDKETKKEAKKKKNKQSEQQELEEEDLDKLVEEIHQEVITTGFKEEAIFKEEQKMADQMKEVLEDQFRKKSSSIKTKDNDSREEIPNIIVPKNIQYESVPQKELNTELRDDKENNNNPVYKFKRNMLTGGIEMVSGANEENQTNTSVINEEKKEITKAMIKSLNSDALKTEIEIYVLEEMVKDEFDHNKAEDLQRRIDTFRNNLEHINKKMKILKAMINKEQ